MPRRVAPIRFTLERAGFVVETKTRIFRAAVVSSIAGSRPSRRGRSLASFTIESPNPAESPAIPAHLARIA